MKRKLCGLLAATMVISAIFTACSSGSQTVSLQDVYSNVTSAYSFSFDNWVTIDKTTLKDEYGLTEDMVVDVKAIKGDGNGSVFIAVEAASGRTGDVQEALEGALAKLRKQANLTPKEEALLKNAQVLQKNDCLFLISIGEIKDDDKEMDMTAQLEIKKGVSAIDEAFTKIEK